MKKIKILITEPVSDMGGVSVFILRIVEYLPKDLFEIHFAADGQGGIKLHLSLVGVFVHDLPLDYRSPFSLWGAVKKQREFVKKEGFDIVFSNTLKSGLVSVWATPQTTKHVYFGQSLRFTQKKNPFSQTIFFLLEWLTCRLSDFNVALSTMELLHARATGLMQVHNSVAIPFSLSTAPFLGDFKTTREKLHEEWNFPLDAFVFGTVARLSPQKDPSTFLEIAARITKTIPTARFVWIGGGPLAGHMRKLATELGLSEKIIFTGDQPKARIPELLNALDVFLYTSLFDGLPISILEAMAAKKIIIAASVNSVPEVIIEGKTGFLFTPKDVAQATQKAIEANLKFKELKFLAENAFALVSKKFAPASRAAENFTLIFKEVLGRI